MFGSGFGVPLREVVDAFGTVVASAFVGVSFGMMGGGGRGRAWGTKVLVVFLVLVGFSFSTGTHWKFPFSHAFSNLFIGTHLLPFLKSTSSWVLKDRNSTGSGIPNPLLSISILLAGRGCEVVLPC